MAWNFLESFVLAAHCMRELPLPSLESPDWHLPARIQVQFVTREVKLARHAHPHARSHPQVPCVSH